MTTNIVIEDNEFVRELERLQDEVQSHQALLSYMVNSDVKPSGKGFKEYSDEYNTLFKAYNAKKSEVTERFVKPVLANPITWILDFKTATLTVEYDAN